MQKNLDGAGGFQATSAEERGEIEPVPGAQFGGMMYQKKSKA